MPPPSSFAQGLRSALPIALGYVPIAFSFGVAATRAGLTGAEAVMFSMLIYSGAAQFVAVPLVTGGASLVVAAVTLIAMNLRHLLYGAALMKQAGLEASSRKSWLWAYGLTDEVFGAALGALARGERRFSEPFMLGLGLGAYASWILGTALGAAAGGEALKDWPALDAALGFMLPALFLALLLSILTKRQIPVILVAAAATALGTALLSPTSGILMGMIAGALAGAAGLGRDRKPEEERA